MATLRQAIFPVCPNCHQGGDDSLHVRCTTPTNREPLLWIDLDTGTQICAACQKSWSVGQGKSSCSCGAVFEGGELWIGMHQEIGQCRNLAWVKRLTAIKGGKTARIVGWDKCSFCGRWDERKRPEFKPRADKVISSPDAGICNRCVRDYLDKWFHFAKKRNTKCCFCYRKSAEVKKLFTGNGKSICGECLEKFQWK